MRLPEAVEITVRFREAFGIMQKAYGHGMKARFCRRHAINNNQLNALLKRPDNRTLPPYYIACLCRDYGVSADWVLTGRGEMIVSAEV